MRSCVLLFLCGCPAIDTVLLEGSSPEPPSLPELDLDCTNTFVRFESFAEHETRYVTGFDRDRRVVLRAREYGGRRYDVEYIKYQARSRIAHVDQDGDDRIDRVCTMTLEEGDVPRIERCVAGDRVLSERRTHYGPHGIVRYEFDEDGDGELEQMYVSEYDGEGNLLRTQSGDSITINDYQDGRRTRTTIDHDGDGTPEYTYLYRVEDGLEIQEGFLGGMLESRFVSDPELGPIETLVDVDRDGIGDTVWRRQHLEGEVRTTVDHRLDGTIDGIGRDVHQEGRILRSIWQLDLPGYVDASTTAYAYDDLGRDMERRLDYRVDDFVGLELLTWSYGCAYAYGEPWPPP